MVKRILCMLLLALMLPCAALADNPMVIDDAKLFSVFEIGDMEQLIRRIEAEYQMDIVVLTTNDVPMSYNESTTQNFAEAYYENNSFGIGEDYAGFMYMIDMTNRIQWITTSGVMIDYIEDFRRENLLDIGGEFLSYAEYGKAAVNVLNQLERQLDEGRLEGSFRFDAETGRRLSGLYNALTGSELLVAAIAGLFVAGMMFASVSGRYNLKGGTYRYDHSNTSCKLIRDDETFLRQSVNVMRHPTNTGGGSSGGSRSSGRGSSVHRSSSGRSFGGGGRRF